MCEATHVKWNIIIRKNKKRGYGVPAISPFLVFTLSINVKCHQSNVQILFYVIDNSFLQSLCIYNLHVLGVAQIEHHERIEVVGESL